jgi:hypothetical protein
MLRACYLDRDPQYVVERQGTAPQPVCKGLALEVFHDQKCGAVMIAHVVQRADVRMVQFRDRVRFALEACSELRVGV